MNYKIINFKNWRKKNLLEETTNVHFQDFSLKKKLKNDNEKDKLMSGKIKLDTGTELPKNFILTEEFKNLFNKIEKTKSNLFITGKAGSGKSTLLEYFRQNTKKNYVICAPTGITAIKARGQTIHSFFKFPPRFVSKSDVKILRDRELLKKLDVLLIDETSMVRADILDAINESLKKNRSSKKPFGGVQVILLGDLLQLSPVVSSTEREVMDEFYPEGPYFFNAKSFNSKDFSIHELSKIFRQKNETFIDLLNKIRIAKIEDKDLELINSRTQDQDYEPEKGVIVLSPRNAKVDHINQYKLNEIDSKLYEFDAEIKGTFKESEYPVEKKLKLKVGAQVMLTKNDNSLPQKWVNGTLATIHEIEKDKIKIDIEGTVHDLGKVKWEKYDYRLNKGMINPKVIATFTQYPLKLAWAATIHKCQGQTFKKVVIDLDAGAFTHGQTYVALSRATSLDGVYLLKDISFNDFIFDKRVFDFLGNKLEKKYIQEIEVRKNKPITNTSSLPYDGPEEDFEEIDDLWSEFEEKKLLMLYKKGLPESALANIFKKTKKEIRNQIIKLLNK